MKISKNITEEKYNLHLTNQKIKAYRILHRTITQA